jgi:hypothetical protein
MQAADRGGPEASQAAGGVLSDAEFERQKHKLLGD